jgi:hypothetical protein
VPDTLLPISPTGLGSSKPLDGIDDRLSSASIRSGKLYTSHAIGVDSSGNATSSPDRDATRWYELSNLSSTPTLSRSGTIFDSGGKSFWMPSIAVSPQGHALVGMSSGGSSARPDAAVSSMLTGDTPAALVRPSVGGDAHRLLGEACRQPAKPIVQLGTAATRLPHRMRRAAAGRSRSHPVRSTRKRLLQLVIPGRSRL